MEGILKSNSTDQSRMVGEKTCHCLLLGKLSILASKLRKRLSCRAGMFRATLPRVSGRYHGLGQGSVFAHCVRIVDIAFALSRNPELSMYAISP